METSFKHTYSNALTCRTEQSKLSKALPANWASRYLLQQLDLLTGDALGIRVERKFYLNIGLPSCLTGIGWNRFLRCFFRIWPGYRAWQQMVRQVEQVRDNGRDDRTCDDSGNDGGVLAPIDNAARKAEQRRDRSNGKSCGHQERCVRRF